MTAKLTIPIVVSAALIDSINPCAFAVLIFLLTYLTAKGAVIYVSKFCPHCEAQKEPFGNSFQYINYVEYNSAWL